MLITLTVSLGIWSADSPHQFELPSLLGAVAVLVFAIAAGFGMWASRGNAYPVVEATEIQAWLQDRWGDTETSARSRVAQYQAATLTVLRDGNSRRYKWVDLALWLQLGGLLLVSGGIAVRLFS